MVPFSPARRPSASSGESSSVTTSTVSGLPVRSGLDLMARGQHLSILQHRLRSAARGPARSLIGQGDERHPPGCRGIRKPATPTTSSDRRAMARMPVGIFPVSPVPAGRRADGRGWVVPPRADRGLGAADDVVDLDEAARRGGGTSATRSWRDLPADDFAGIEGAGGGHVLVRAGRTGVARHERICG